jgi:hypothetical protein
LRFGWYVRGPHLGPVHTYWAPDRRPKPRPRPAPPATRPGQVWYSRPRTAGTAAAWWVYIAIAAVVTFAASKWTPWAAVASGVMFAALAVLAGLGQRHAGTGGRSRQGR